MSVTVRRAEAADVEAIRRVGLLTWPPTYLPISSADYVVANLNRWWSAESVAHSIQEEATFVAEADGEVVGTATLGDYGGEPVIWKIYVLPERHGTGVGAALMVTALDAAPSGRDVLIEFVEGNTTAQRFYERFGFAHERTEPGELGTTTVWYRLSRS